MAQYYKTIAGGVNIPFDGNGLLAYTEDITEAKTLLGSDSGKVFSLNAAAGVAITLPAVQAGLNYRIITGADFATTDFTIVAATEVIQGIITVNGAPVRADDSSVISFVASAGVKGDYVDIVSDGINWYVSGAGFSAGAITFTAP
tara:strand:- start:27348 stop:27782 length:435 start_codon:yes stop_codon:yes gene_type:complete